MSAGSDLVASGTIVHLVLPVLGCVSCVPNEDLDDQESDQDESADAASHQLVEDCRKCVYTTSLAHSQRVAERVQQLAQQKVSAR